MGTYVAFTTAEFEAFLKANNLPAVFKQIPGTYERVYDLPVVGRQGVQYPAIVRIYSSIQLGDEVTRSVGSDAIRMVLLRSDYKTERSPDGVPLKGVEEKAFRTKNAFSNMLERVRTLYGRAMRQTCPSCGKSLMQKRKRGSDGAEFYGCVHYPTCREIQTVEWVENAQREPRVQATGIPLVQSNERDNTKFAVKPGKKVDAVWQTGYYDGLNNRNPSKYEPVDDEDQVHYITGYRCGVRAQTGLERERSEEGDRLYQFEKETG